jgi:hypothetical protein
MLHLQLRFQFTVMLMIWMLERGSFTTFSSSLLGLIGLTLIVLKVWVTCDFDFLCVTYPPATYETSKISKTFGKMIFTTSLYCYDMLDCDNNTTGWCIEVDGFFHSDNKCHFYPCNFEIGANTHASPFYTNIFFMVPSHSSWQVFCAIAPIPHTCSLSHWILD